MIIIMARAEVSPDMVEEYMRLAKELASASRLEAGCISYTLHRSTDNPAVFAVIEQWSNAEAIAGHNASEHFTRIVPQLGRMRISSSVDHLIAVE